MRKFIAAVILLFMCLPLCKAEAPFALLEEGAADYSITDKLAAKQKVTFKIKDYVNKQTNPDLITYTQTAFAEWFGNVLTLAVRNEKSAQVIKPFEDKIKFAATPANYRNVAYGEKADLEVRFTDLSMIKKACEDSAAAGCYIPDDKIIWAVYPEKITPPFSKTDKDRMVIIHEFGHAITLDDLYHGGFYGGENFSDRQHGSGIQKSIMNKEPYLTCDDADAAVFVVYYAIRRKKPSMPEFDFPSFCKGREFKKGVLVNQEFSYDDEDGFRMFFTNCNGSNVVPALKVNIKNFKNPFEFIQDKKCVAPILGDNSFKNITGNIESYKKVFPYLADYSKNILAKNKEEKIYHKALTKGAGAIDLFVHTGGFTPLFAYAVAEGKILYLYAYLDEGYNFIYDYPFRFGYKHGSDSCGLAGCHEKHGLNEVFVYSQEYPYPVYVMGNREDNKTLCAYRQKDCEKMRDAGRKYRAFFEQNLGTVQPLGGWLSAERQKKVTESLSWHYSLIKMFPPKKKYVNQFQIGFKDFGSNAGKTQQGKKVSGQITRLNFF